MRVLRSLLWLDCGAGLLNGALTAIIVAANASKFGLAHLLVESLLVGGLAALEWRNRELLLVAP